MLDLVSAIAISGYEQNFSDFSARLQVRLFVNEDHNIDCLSDQRLLGSTGGLRDEAFEANQSANRVVCVNRRGTAGMTCVPRFQKGVRLSAAYFADDNTRRLETHARSQACEHRHVANRAKVQVVLHRAL